MGSTSNFDLGTLDRNADLTRPFIRLSASTMSFFGLRAWPTPFLRPMWSVLRYDLSEVAELTLEENLL